MTRTLCFQTERYARNPDVPEDEDIDEIVYFADAIQIKYHRSRERHYVLQVIGHLLIIFLELVRPVLF